jgi:(p)ppGpp synthase/HD superfamily hydrolase
MHSSSRTIDLAVERSPLVADAMAAAREAHGEQTRQTGAGEIPFLDHLTAVAERLAAQGHEADEVLAAALLHDTVEREALEPEALRERFGEAVAEIVAALTEDGSIEDYEERKDEHRDRVAEASPEARAVFAADKAANVAVLRAAYESEGEGVEEALPVALDRKILIWEYDLEMLFDELPGPLADGLADELVGLWKQRADEEERQRLQAFLN